MTNENASPDIRLEVRYDEDFKRQVSGDGRPYNPRVSLSITVGDTSLSGPEKGYTGVYLTNFLGEALQAIKAIENGEKKILKTGDGPVYLVFDPWDDGTVAFAKCFTRESANNPDERLSVEPEVLVTEAALRDEIIRLSDEAVSKITEINPEVKDHRQIRELEELIHEVKTSSDYPT